MKMDLPKFKVIKHVYRHVKQRDFRVGPSKQSSAFTHSISA